MNMLNTRNFIKNVLISFTFYQKEKNYYAVFTV